MANADDLSIKVRHLKEIGSLTSDIDKWEKLKKIGEEIGRKKDKVFHHSEWTIEEDRIRTLEANDSKHFDRVRRMVQKENQKIKTISQEAKVRRSEMSAQYLAQRKAAEEDRRWKNEDGMKRCAEAQKLTEECQKAFFDENLERRTILDAQKTSQKEEISQMKRCELGIQEQIAKRDIRHKETRTQIEMARENTRGKMKICETQSHNTAMNESLRETVMNLIDKIGYSYQTVSAKVAYALSVNAMVLIEHGQVILNDISNKLHSLREKLKLFKQRNINDDEIQKCCDDLLGNVIQINGNCTALALSVDSKSAIDLEIVASDYQHLVNNIEQMRSNQIRLAHIELRKHKLAREICKEQVSIIRSICSEDIDFDHQRNLHNVFDDSEDEDNFRPVYGSIPMRRVSARNDKNA